MGGKSSRESNCSQLELTLEERGSLCELRGEQRRGRGRGQPLSIPSPPPPPRPQSGALQEFPINNFQLHLTIHSQFLPPRAPSGWSAAGLVPPTPSPRTSRTRSEGRAPSSDPGRFCSTSGGSRLCCRTEISAPGGSRRPCSHPCTLKGAGEEEGEGNLVSAPPPSPRRGATKGWTPLPSFSVPRLLSSPRGASNSNHVTRLLGEF